MAGRKSDFTLPTNTLDELFSSQEERDEAKLSKIRDIPLEEIDDFPDHPFKVREDEDMFQLVESIKERGVITPATVTYELTVDSGTARLYWLDKGEEKMIVDTSKNGTYSVTLDEGDNYLTLEGNDFCGSLQVVVE